jgi:hypothetical protein
MTPKDGYDQTGNVPVLLRTTLDRLGSSTGLVGCWAFSDSELKALSKWANKAIEDGIVDPDDESGITFDIVAYCVAWILSNRAAMLHNAELPPQIDGWMLTTVDGRRTYSLDNVLKNLRKYPDEDALYAAVLYSSRCPM